MAASHNYNTEFSANTGKSAVDCLVLDKILAGGSTGSINHSYITSSRSI